MMMDQIYGMLQPSVEGLGFELWGVEYLPQGRKSVLRIYIDAEEGIDVDDCAAVSHQVSGVLDVEDPISGEYFLEVSSPGMDRPLFRLDQYSLYLGERLNVRLHRAIENRRHFKGILQQVEGDVLTFVVDGEQFEVPFRQVAKANVSPTFD